MTDMTRGCPRLDALAGWVEGTLSPEDRAAVAAHLSDCDRCRRSVVLASGMEAPAGGEVNEVLLERVVRAARKRPLWSWAAAAALLVALILAFVLARKEPADQAPVVKTPPTPVAPEPSVVVKSAPAPQPAPQVERELPVRPPAPPRPSRRSVARKGDFRSTPPEAPKRAPPHEAPKLPAFVKDRGRTETDLDRIFTPVFIVDPTATLRLSRAGAEAEAVARYEQVTRHDRFSAPLQGAAFTLEAKASVVLEEGSETRVSYFKPDNAFALTPLKGLVMVDTEGLTQSWRFERGGSSLRFPEVNGQLAVEPRGERLVAVLLSGDALVNVGGERKSAQVGREVVLSRDGASEKDLMKRGAMLSRLRRLERLRPKVSTAFAATFDEKGAVRPFPYTLVAGRVKEERKGLFLHGVFDEKASRPGRTICMAALKPKHPFEATSGMVLRFRYRTSARSITIRLGKHSSKFPARAGGWREGEIPLSRFSHEGVMMVSSDPIGDIRFEGVFENNSGTLDVDAVQFLRRAR